MKKNTSSFINSQRFDSPKALKAVMGVSLMELVIALGIISTVWYFAASKIKKSNIAYETPTAKVFLPYELTLKQWGQKIRATRGNLELRKKVMAEQEVILRKFIPRCHSEKSQYKNRSNFLPDGSMNYFSCSFMLFNAGSAIINGGIVAASPMSVVGYVNDKGEYKAMPQYSTEEEKNGNVVTRHFYNNAILFGVWFDTKPKNVYFVEDSVYSTGANKRAVTKVHAIVDGIEWKSELTFYNTADGGVVAGKIFAPPKDVAMDVMVLQQGSPFREFGALSSPKISKINNQNFAVLVLAN